MIEIDGHEYWYPVFNINGAVGAKKLSLMVYGSSRIWHYNEATDEVELMENHGGSATTSALEEITIARSEIAAIPGNAIGVAQLSKDAVTYKIIG